MASLQNSIHYFLLSINVEVHHILNEILKAILNVGLKSIECKKIECILFLPYSKKM